MLLISKLSNLIYDGLREKIVASPNKYVKAFPVDHPESGNQYIGFQIPEEVVMENYPIPLDTPALQFIMNLLIEKVQKLNSTPPNQLVMPDGPITYEVTANFIKEAYAKLDSLDGLAVPDLCAQQTPSQPGQGKMKFYRELDAEFNKHPF